MIDNFSSGQLWVAFLVTLFAGLSTGIGSTIAFFANRTNTRLLSFSLGFSAGVMIFVSLVEIFVKARKVLVIEYGELDGYWLTLAGFFLGIIVIGIIDKLIPSVENPHEIKKLEDIGMKNGTRQNNLIRMGMFTALALGIHNFPEGLATFTATLNDPAVGLAIAVAIAIHNIPEGIAVSVPVYYATGNRKKAFFLSFLSGLAEPVGAIIGYLILLPFMNNTVFGLLFASVAGIMIFISLDELLPSAREYGHHHISIYGLILGMVVMAVSLAMFL